MILHHIYYQLVIVGLLWLCVMLHYVWPSPDALSPQPPAQPVPPQVRRKRSTLPPNQLPPFTSQAAGLAGSLGDMLSL
jgi:hypothetical protein